MKTVFFLAAFAVPLLVLAEPGDAALGEVVRRQPSPTLLARSGIPTSSISKECKSKCSPIISTLDACKGVAECECTQSNFDSLANCLNCLQALGPPDPLGRANAYDGEFEQVCADFGIGLIYDIAITAIATGIASTGDPFSIFEQPTPTAGATKAASIQEDPLIPTQESRSGVTGGAVRLGSLQSLLIAGVVGAVAAAAIVVGRLPL